MMRSTSVQLLSRGLSTTFPHLQIEACRLFPFHQSLLTSFAPRNASSFSPARSSSTLMPVQVRKKSTDNNGNGNGEELNEHFKLDKVKHPLGAEFMKKHNLKTTSYWDNPVPHHIYSPQELDSIEQTHKEPSQMHERVALFAVKLMRGGFDLVSRYKGAGGEMTKRAWLNRCLFLETVAGYLKNSFIKSIF